MRERKPDTRTVGRHGEALAERYLEDHGLRILARNVHLRHAEIDLIALDAGTLCFVEVRLRKGDRFGSAAASVDRRKQQKLGRAAAEWLARGLAPRHAQLRFDVVAIDTSCEPPRVEHFADAFARA